MSYLISDTEREEYELYKKLVKTLSTRKLTGVGHGNKIKLVITCPMYGDEEEISVEDVLKRIK
jgi:hypothetical protein